MKYMYVTLSILFALVSSFAEDESSLKYEGVFKPLYDHGSTSSFLNRHYSEVLDSTDDIKTAKDSLHIDFEGRQITYTKVDTLTGLVYESYHYNEMTQYFEDMYNQSIYDLWKSGLKEPGRAGREKKVDSSKIVFKAPVHLPRWAKRIVGDEPPKLSITGMQKLKLGFRRTETGSKNGSDNKKVKEPIFQPSTEFSIKGTVGRLLELEIRLKGNKSEDGGYFDDSNIQKQLDEIKIHYHSDSVGELEDDIIQEVIIGKTNFSMPGLGLIGYPSGGDGGLFGVKIRSKVGPLDLTTIASIESVENEEKTIKLDAGSRPDTISEKQYLKNRFFFINNLYRELYIRKSDQAAQIAYLESHDYKTIPTIENITIYEKVEDSYKNSADVKYIFLDEQSTEPYKFRRLTGNKDYFLSTRYNFVRFNSALRDNSIIVMEVKYSDGLTNVVADSVKTTIDGQEFWALRNLAYLKKSNHEEVDSVYNLMLRNVYEIKRGDGSDFTFDVLRKNPDGTVNSSNDQNIKFIDILQLTKDGLIDKSNVDIFDHENGFLYIPPFVPSAEGEVGAYPFTNTKLGTNNSETNANTKMYYDSIKADDVPSNFQIATSSSEKLTSFSLGFGIKDGTEKIWNGSDTLRKNVDYTISYFSGTVDLISSKAKSYNELRATYQKESLFLLDKKVLFGINGMLKFPNIGRNSYLSTTLMWQRMNAKSITPKIGTEPYNRFAIGANLMLDFEPEWMTRAVNKLPGVETEAKSTARFSMEIAHSKVKTSAKNGGRAYIDNFSTSEQNLRLETSHERWYRASIDYEDIRLGIAEDTTAYYRNIPAWQSYWYKPLHEDEKTNYYTIYPKPTDTTGNNYNRDEKVSSLKLVVHPFPTSTTLMDNIADAEDTNLVKPWAGIMRGLNGRLTRRKDDRYFEFWVDLENEEGMLYVDFGEISEDLSLDGTKPNNRENYEKFSGAPTLAEDLGIDATHDTLEYWCFPKYDNTNTTSPWSWDTLRYDASGAGPLGKFAKDPARDNWKRFDNRDGNNDNKSFANGSEGSNAKYNPQFVEGETEDFNKDGKFLNIRSSQFFRYKIPLNYATLTDPTGDYNFKKANDTTTKWVKVRLPISVLAKEFKGVIDTVQEPNWDDVEQVRLLWKDLKTDYSPVDSLSLEFADMQFVGNQWSEFLDVFGKDSTELEDIYNEAGKVTATVLNTKKDDKLHLPINMEYDSISDEEQANHTLVLSFEEVANSSSEDQYAYVAVERKYDSRYSSIDFSPYEDINIMVSDTSDEIFVNPNDSVWFTFRFGTTDSAYFEYRTRIAYDNRSQSFDRNESWKYHTINLNMLTQLKLKWFNVHGERFGHIDTSQVLEQVTDVNGTFTTKLIRVYSANNTMPSLTDINWMSFGILTSSSTPYNGRIMLNNFQASGLRSYSGTAMKTGLDLKWADLLDNNFGISYRDASFRSMSDDVHKRSSSEMDGGLSTDLYLDKFMPSKWGIRLPIGGSANAKLSRPELRPNSDISLRDENGDADGFSDMSKDFMNLLTKPGTFQSEVTEAEKYQTENNDYRFYTSYKKTKDSNNPVVNLTADRVEVSYDYTEKNTNERQGLVPLDEKGKVTSGSEYHEKINKSESQTFKLSYDLSPNRKLQNKLKLKPFKKLDNRKIRKIEMNLLPEKIRFDLLDIGYNHSEDYNSIDEVVKENYTKVIQEKLGLDHSFELQYKPISPLLEITSNLGIKRNFERYLYTNDYKAIDVIMSDVIYDFDNTWRGFYILTNEENRNRKINLKVTPNLSNWLTFSMKMNTDYGQDVDLASPEKYLKSDIGNDVNLSSTFQVKRLFDRFAEFQKSRADKKKKEAKDSEKVSDSKEKDTKDGKGAKEKKKDVFFKRVAKGLDKVNFERIKFSYDADMQLKSSYLDMAYFEQHKDMGEFNYFDYLKYSMGLYGRSFGDIMTGRMDDSTFGGVQHRNDYWQAGFQKNDADKRSTSQKFSVSSSFDLPKPLDLKFNTLSLKWSRNYFVTPKSTRFDTTTTWPEIKVGMRSSVLEKVGEIKKHFRNLNLSTGFTYDLKTVHSSDFWDEKDSASLASSKAKMSYTTGYGFKPLMKLDGTLKKKRIDVSYSMDLYFDTTHTDEIYHEASSRGSGLDKKTRYEDSEKGIEKNHKWTFSYKKTGKKGKTIKIFKNKEIKIKGDVEYRGDMGLLVEDTRKYIANVNNEREEEEEFTDRTFTLEPSVKYELTDKVSCELYYHMRRKLNGKSETIDNKDEIAGEITIKF